MTNLNQDPLIGQQLDEYELVALLGRGGMARVYRGRDVRLKRDVAIKVIDAIYRADESYRARFEREAQAIAQLEHPHIVRLYRYGEVSGLFYMAMQYIPGQDLRSYLDDLRAAKTATSAMLSAGVPISPILVWPCWPTATRRATFLARRTTWPRSRRCRRRGWCRRAICMRWA